MSELINSPVISPRSLLDCYNEEQLVVVDASNGKDALDQYKAAHLTGANFVHLNTDLSAVNDPSKGGRHPLPSIEKFKKVVQRLGIDDKSRVVVYDRLNGANAAARFWWMLRSTGYTKVHILDGGFQAAVQEGIPISSHEVTPRQASSFKAKEWLLPSVNITEVKKAIQDDAFLIIDVRASERYLGLSEPIDLIAGHIPRAVNIPYTSNLNNTGSFLSPGALRALYTNYTSQFDEDKIIVHCGSGVTACHTLCAFDYAGMRIPKLYVGSWSEWSRNDVPKVLKG